MWYIANAGLAKSVNTKCLNFENSYRTFQRHKLDKQNDWMSWINFFYLNSHFLIYFLFFVNQFTEICT